MGTDPSLEQMYLMAYLLEFSIVENVSLVWFDAQASLVLSTSAPSSDDDREDEDDDRNDEDEENKLEYGADDERDTPNLAEFLFSDWGIGRLVA